MSERGFDVVEDEEQGVKFLEITELLVAAGYFRARIKGLAPFDKVSHFKGDIVRFPQLYLFLN